MKQYLKQGVKNIANFFHIYITKNQLYDSQTQRVLQRLLKKDSNCIDVGCHKGEVLDQMLQFAPSGQHFGFEPIPDLYSSLKERYNADKRVTIFDVALSDESGSFQFNYVVSNPSYSGLLKRDYDRPTEKDTQIQVRTERLDSVLSEKIPVDFMKIDVEGAEFIVLQGARQLIRREKPHIVFEFGMGAANHYGVQPKDIFGFFSDLTMGIQTLGGFLDDVPSFDEVAFHEQYVKRKNYYFIAYPMTSK